MFGEARIDGVLLVMESGSEWPSWVEGCKLGTGNTRVIAQEEGETAQALASRVTERCKRLSRQPLGLGIIACTHRTDSTTLSARKQIAEAMAEALGRQGGRLMLTSGEHAEDPVLSALSDLCAELGHGKREFAPVSRQRQRNRGATRRHVA